MELLLPVIQKDKFGFWILDLVILQVLDSGFWIWLFTSIGFWVWTLDFLQVLDSGNFDRYWMIADVKIVKIIAFILNFRSSAFIQRRLVEFLRCLPTSYLYRLDFSCASTTGW